MGKLHETWSMDDYIKTKQVDWACTVTPYVERISSVMSLNGLSYITIRSDECNLDLSIQYLSIGQFATF